MNETTNTAMTMDEIKAKEAQVKAELKALRNQKKALKGTGKPRLTIVPFVTELVKSNMSKSLDDVLRELVTAHPEFAVATIVSTGRKIYNKLHGKRDTAAASAE